MVGCKFTQGLGFGTLELKVWDLEFRALGLRLVAFGYRITLSDVLVVCIGVQSITLPSAPVQDAGT